MTLFGEVRILSSSHVRRLRDSSSDRESIGARRNRFLSLWHRRTPYESQVNEWISEIAHVIVVFSRMLNQVRCALAFYGLHDKRECAFRIDTLSEQDRDDDESTSHDIRMDD